LGDELLDVTKALETNLLSDERRTNSPFTRTSTSYRRPGWIE